MLGKGRRGPRRHTPGGKLENKRPENCDDRHNGAEEHDGNNSQPAASTCGHVIAFTPPHRLMPAAVAVSSNLLTHFADAGAGKRMG